MSRLYKDKSLWLHGFVNLYKPCGMTSSDAVCIVRGALSASAGGRQKAGHLGTLDPLAEGVLPIAVGSAAKLFDYLAFKRKKYRAEFRFGVATDTLDRGGKITESGGRVPVESEIAEAARKLTGEIMQVPPVYSAKSVNGKRAYKYARCGETPTLAPRRVTVYGFELTDRTGIDTFSFDIECGGGTYIRALARDMGEMLGTYAHMTALTRLASGVFDAGNSVTVDEFKTDPAKYVLPTEYALGSFPECRLNEAQAFKTLNGVPVYVRKSDITLPYGSGCGTEKNSGCISVDENAGREAVFFPQGAQTLYTAVRGAGGELLGIAAANCTDDDAVSVRMKTRL